jgi:hypothetical protein
LIIPFVCSPVFPRTKPRRSTMFYNLPLLHHLYSSTFFLIPNPALMYRKVPCWSLYNTVVLHHVTFYTSNRKLLAFFVCAFELCLRLWRLWLWTWSLFRLCYNKFKA